MFEKTVDWQHFTYSSTVFLFSYTLNILNFKILKTKKKKVKEGYVFHHIYVPTISTDNIFICSKCIHAFMYNETYKDQRDIYRDRLIDSVRQTVVYMKSRVSLCVILMSRNVYTCKMYLMIYRSPPSQHVVHQPLTYIYLDTQELVTAARKLSINKDNNLTRCT